MLIAFNSYTARLRLKQFGRTIANSVEQKQRILLKLYTIYEFIDHGMSTIDVLAQVRSN